MRAVLSSPALRSWWWRFRALFIKEWRGYFSSLLGPLFLFVFLLSSGALPFYVTNFLSRNEASLIAFFSLLPWIFIVFAPAITMRLWSEERKIGTIEILLTLPVGIGTAVCAKFFAAWLFVGLGLVLTFPFWIIVNLLGDADNGVIAGGYISAFLLAGVMVAIGGFFSATTKNQITAFIASTSFCFLLVVSGTRGIINLFADWAGEFIIRIVLGLSLLNHFLDMQRGLIDFQALIYFITLSLLFIYLTILVLEKVKAK